MAGEVRPNSKATAYPWRRSSSAVSTFLCHHKRLRLAVRFPLGNDGDGLSIETAPDVLTPNYR